MTLLYRKHYMTLLYCIGNIDMTLLYRVTLDSTDKPEKWVEHVKLIINIIQNNVRISIF